MANAGIAAAGFIRSIDPAAFEKVIEVDLLGVWRTVRVCLPALIASRGYCLVVSSMAAVVHIPGNAPYNAAKAGVEAFANTLRAEVRHLGVDVGVAHPTWIATDMVNSADEHPVFGPAAQVDADGVGPDVPALVRGRRLREGHRPAVADHPHSVVVVAGQAAAGAVAAGGGAWRTRDRARTPTRPRWPTSSSGARGGHPAPVGPGGAAAMRAG